MRSRLSFKGLLRSCRTSRRARQGQRGMALLIVMGVAAVTGVMAAHLMTISEVVAMEAKVAAVRTELRYAAESLADRGFWMHMVDRRLYPDRTLGRERDLAAEQMGEAWMLDGRPHQVEGMPGQVFLLDADAGVDVSGTEPGRALRDAVDPEDSERRDLVDRFLDVAADYVDSNDNVHLHGMEKADYEALGLYGLPRNAPFQYREEVYWLPGWYEVIMGQIRIIPPNGLSFAGGTTPRPSFFSSSAETIRRVAGLSEIELDAVMAAREQWSAQGVLLEQSLDPLLYAKLQRSFSFQESGVVRIVVEVQSPTGEIRRVLQVTRDADYRRAGVFSDSSKEAWALWEWGVN